MKLPRLTLFIIALLSTPMGFSAPPQEKMMSCNDQADEKNLKDEERRQFMNDCLQLTRQVQMISCSKEATAKSLRGDERKAFMSQCLKKN